MAVAFDEMRAANGPVRPAYLVLPGWLKRVPPDALDYRRREAETLSAAMHVAQSERQPQN